MPRLRDRIRLLRRGVSAAISEHRLTALALVAILSVTLTVPLVARSVTPADRITIGNTAGVLTALIEINEQRILVGAGPTRAHSADLVGRSTRPWDREIHLLIVPGWDNNHAVGALGLLEKRGVAGVTVLGIPGDDPAWTLLERQAREDDIPLRYLAGAHQLDLGPETMLRMSGLEQGDGAWIRLDYQGLRVDLVDTNDIRTAAPPVTQFQNSNDHVLVNMRSQSAPAFAHPELLLQPRPFYRDEFSEAGARFVHELDRDERIKLRLTEGELRAPINGIGP